MQELIHDLLALSRVGTHGRAPGPVDTARVVAGVLRWLGGALEESGGEVVADALPTVVAIAGQLEQLFQNLIANALKFRRPGVAPRVEVSALRLADGTPRAAWRFTVRDNGIGFEPQFADQIFTVFQRLHTRAEYAGTGVGLAICRKIVERHGGTIWAEGTPGAGSAFHFTLPDRAPDRAPDASADPTDDAERTP